MRLPEDVRALVAAGPLAHLTTINRDGGPQVSAIWLGLDGSHGDDELVSGHVVHSLKLRNIARDPRVALSFAAPAEPGEYMQKHVALRARATIEPSDDTWTLLDRLTKVYVGPEVTFPIPPKPGWIVRYTVERVSGIGPWAQG